LNAASDEDCGFMKIAALFSVHSFIQIASESNPANMHFLVTKYRNEVNTTPQQLTV
jgi:hypothetical protein